MRNFLIAVIVVLLVPFAAQAFSVPEEVQVTSPPPAVAEAAPAPAPAPANNKAYKAVKSLDRRLVGKKGMVTLIKEKVQNLYSEITATKTAATDAQTKAEAAMASAINAKNAVIALDAKLTDKNTGEFKKLSDTAWSVGNELSKDMKIYTGLIIIAVIGLGIFIFFRTGGTNALVKGVHTAVKDVPAAVKALDPLVIELDDVAGHHVKYDAPIVDNMYVTCYVPSTVTSPVANPAQIVPTRMTDRGAVRRSIRKTMADYFTKLAANTNPATEQDRQQKALIEHLIATGQLVVS